MSGRGIAEDHLQIRGAGRCRRAEAVGTAEAPGNVNVGGDCVDGCRTEVDVGYIVEAQLYRRLDRRIVGAAVETKCVGVASRGAYLL